MSSPATETRSGARTTFSTGAVLGAPVPRPRPDRPAPRIRWTLTHPIEETGRHAGHADILRELSDGMTGR
ncbi:MULTISPECIES: DUF664 domain-containing protein [unclassified Streptomyces]|uniref:mycothiol transferase n=1 Tax=Streptomyces TaxID=1883 RepID=UPI0036276B12